MITRKWKLLCVMCGFATLIYIHGSDNKLLKEYKQNVQRHITYIIERAHLPNNTDIQALLTSLENPESTTFEKPKTDHPSVSSGISTQKKEPIHSVVDFKHNQRKTGSVSGSVPGSVSRKGIHAKTKNKVVVFPSVSHCDKKEHNLMIKNHKGPTVPTRDIYPCKKWKSPRPNDQMWPVVIKPTNGKVLNSIDIGSVKSKVRDRVSEQLVVQQKRLRTIKDTCAKYPELAIRQHTTLVWDTKTEPPVLYCPLYKVASTTWMVYFLRLAHVNDENPALEMYNKSGKEKKKYMPRFGGGHQRVFKEFKAPTTSKERNKVFHKSLRFIAVRHPFTRILSAYRDKIERPNPRPFSPYFKDLQSAIIRKYRPKGTNVTSVTPTFSEFIDFVIESTEHLKTAKDWEENVICWTPFWSQCGVCSSDYQVIVKLETMDNDEQFLAHIANLKEIQNVHEWRNLKRSSVSSSAVSPKYYGSLTKEQILNLYERYKIDFELFGYTLEEYL